MKPSNIITGHAPQYLPTFEEDEEAGRLRLVVWSLFALVIFIGVMAYATVRTFESNWGLSDTSSYERTIR